MPDNVDNLPTNESVPTRTELKIVENIFTKENKGIMERLLGSLKDVFIAGIIFLIFSANFVDETIKSFVPSANISTTMLLGIKTLLFMFVFFFVKNFYLSKKIN